MFLEVNIKILRNLTVRMSSWQQCCCPWSAPLAICLATIRPRSQWGSRDEQPDRCTIAHGVMPFTFQFIGGICAGLLYAAFHASGPKQDTAFGLVPAADYDLFRPV